MRIYSVPESRRYWVVRAEGGAYFEHFRRFGFIALGHLNIAELKATEDFKAAYNWDSVAKLINSKLLFDKKSRRSAQVNISQAKTFIYDINPGDWVITVGNQRILFGRVSGHAYIEPSPAVIVYDPKSDRKHEMNLHLRRSVQWGPSIGRDELPFGLLRSLRANQTIFSLDKNWEAIHHTLYPAFRRGDKLYLSSKIQTKSAIKNHSIATIFRLLDELELIGQQPSLIDNPDQFDAVFAEYINSGAPTITTKASFHSPGEIWNAITAIAGSIKDIDNWAYMTVAGYSMLFGNSKLGFDGIIDIETRRKLWDLIISRVKKNNAEKVVEALSLELPKIDTSKLEDKDNN